MKRPSSKKVTTTSGQLPEPEFTNPPLVEAIGEFRYIPEEGFKWSPTTVPEIIAIMNEYPGFDTILEQGVQIDFDSGTIGHKFMQPRSRYKCTNETNGRSLIFQEGSFALSFTKYTNSCEFRSTFLENWERIKKVLKPGSISQVGLRYVNRIQLKDNDTIVDIIKPGDYFGKSAITDDSFRIDQETLDDDARRLISLVYNKDKKELIFDIDRIYLDTLKKNDLSTMATLEEINSEIRNIFLTSITDKFIERIKPNSSLYSLLEVQYGYKPK